MDRQKSGFVDIDALMAQVSLEQVAAYYRLPLPDIQCIGNEIRMRCFLNCGRQGETGERALAIQPEHPAKIWRCFDASCGRGGNLVSLCDLMKPGDHAEGKPRGERFKAILADLQAMAAGETPLQGGTTAESHAEPTPPATRRAGNIRLAESPNERARALVTLDQKFVTDPACMSPKAASYFRHRPFLTREACRRWRVGYLPRDTGGDHAGGTMRGKIVYPMLSEAGEILTWFGRDPEFEGKEQEWLAGGKQGKEPEKVHFVKGFERGRELFGQHRIHEEGAAERLRGIGLLVVKGPNDVIALDTLGVPAVGLCGTNVTGEQREKITRLAQELGGGIVTVMFDRDEEGELAARQAVVCLAQACPVRLAWSEAMHGAAFRGREAESLTPEEWSRIHAFLVESVGGQAR